MGTSATLATWAGSLLLSRWLRTAAVISSRSVSPRLTHFGAPAGSLSQSNAAGAYAKADAGSGSARTNDRKPLVARTTSS